MPSRIHPFLNRFLNRIELYTGTNMAYLIQSGFWMNLSTVITSLLAFGIYVLAANLVSKEVYGTYQYLLSLGAIAVAFTLTGMNGALARAVAQGQESTARASIRIQLTWALVPLTGSLLVGTYYLIQGNSTLGVGCIAIALSTPIITTFNSYGAILLGRGNFRSGFFYGLLVSIPTYAAIALTMVFIPGALTLLVVNLCTTAITTAIAYVHLVRTRPLKGSIDTGTLLYGKHLSLMSVPGTIAAQIDALLVFHVLGPAQVALYAFSTAIPDRFGSLLKFIPTAALPRFTKRSREELQATLGRKLFQLGVVSLLAAGAYAVLAPYIFTFFFAPYHDAIPYSQLYSLVIVAIVGNVATSALTAHQSIGDLYRLNIILPVIQIIFLVVGIFTFGLWGLILGKVAYSLVAAVLPIVLFLQNRRYI